MSTCQYGSSNVSINANLGLQMPTWVFKRQHKCQHGYMAMTVVMPFSIYEIVFGCACLRGLNVVTVKSRGKSTELLRINITDNND